MRDPITGQRGTPGFWWVATMMVVLGLLAFLCFARYSFIEPPAVGPS